MRFFPAFLSFFLCFLSPAFAGEMISVELGRGFSGKAAVLSALVRMAPQPNGKALLLFPGWPGIPRIEDRAGVPAFSYLQEHFEEMQPALHAAGISTVQAGPADYRAGRQSLVGSLR